MYEFRNLMQDLSTISGGKIKGLREYEANVENYQEAILDKQVASLKQEMNDRFVSKKFEEAEIAIQALRDKLVENLLLNQPNAPLIQKTIDEIIHLEKERGFYDPENWRGLPGI